MFFYSIPMHFLLSFLPIFLIFVPANGQQKPSTVVAKTSYGPLGGFVHPLGSGQSVDVFLGVPYAAPPIGPLRFEKPIPPNKWEDVRPVTQAALGCVPVARPTAADRKRNVATSVAYSEDCLYLNLVAQHQTDANASSPLRPILVIIHGGGFVVGSSHRYDYADIGEKFALRGILVATVQHRLGILGFASSGDKTMPGNLGLWDLLAALRWIRSEAKAFGGDPKRITLLGFSAGSAAISALGMCPFARDLFHQGIQMSGSILAQSKTGAPVANETKALALELGCPTECSFGLKECLRGKSVDELHNAMAKLNPTRSDVNFCKFGPRRDGHFFPRDFPELIHESPPKRTLVGYSRLESLAYTLLQGQNDSMTQYAIPKDKISVYGQADFEAFVRDVVAKEEHFGPTKAKQIQREIVKFFAEYDAHEKKDSTFWLERHSMVLTDLHYIMPCVWESRLKLNLGWPIWLYENAYFDPSTIPEHVKVHGASHGSDHDLMFMNPARKQVQFSEQSLQVGKLLINSFVNFVLNGDPSTETAKWIMASQKDPMRHLLIDGPTPKMMEDIDIRRLKFWHTLIETHHEYNLVRGTRGREDGEHDEL